MSNTHAQSRKITCFLIKLSLVTLLLGSCSRSQQLGIGETPQEILDRKLNNPEAMLTPDQSITLLNYCAELGEQNAATAAEKIVTMVVGNTGAGKSTTINALLGCQMKAVKPRELGLPGIKKIVVVDPESPRKEVMPIGHGTRSRTFMPQIVQTPDEPNSAYCDCPGFADTRGAEINIANAINIRKVLQQATGVRAVFLTSYNGLGDGRRGGSVRAMESMCHQLFGGIDNLRRCQNAVLLGITKAPLYNRRGQPIAISSVRLKLTQVNTPIAQILANRIFLFDPLDRATDNPDFWSLVRCRNEIDQLDSIPQHEATTLFQTVFTDSDRSHLLNTIRQLQPKIISAITQGDVTTLGQHWKLLQHLRVIEHPEVEQLIEDQVFPVVNIAILQKVAEVESSASVFNFDDAQRKLDKLTSMVSHLPGVPLVCHIDEIQRHVSACQANKDNKEACTRQIAELNKEMEELHRRMKALKKNPRSLRDILVSVGRGAVLGLLSFGPAGAVAGAIAGVFVDPKEVIAEGNISPE